MDDFDSSTMAEYYLEKDREDEIMEINEDKLISTGSNVKFNQYGNTLLITIQLDKTIGLSSTGKMMGIASTNGFVQLDVDTGRGKRVKMNLYLGEQAS